MSDSVLPHRRQPTRLLCPRDSPGKNTGMGFHFLLQCMKVKSESEVAQSCPTLSNPMDCSPPGSSVHGIFQARVLESGAIAFFVLQARLSFFHRFEWHFNFFSFPVICLFSFFTLWWVLPCNLCFFFFHFLFLFFFKFNFIFKLYNIVLVLPNIEMNLPQVYMWM